MLDTDNSALEIFRGLSDCVFFWNSKISLRGKRAIPSWKQFLVHLSLLHLLFHQKVILSTTTGLLCVHFKKVLQTASSPSCTAPFSTKKHLSQSFNTQPFKDITKVSQEAILEPGVLNETQILNPCLIFKMYLFAYGAIKITNTKVTTTTIAIITALYQSLPETKKAISSPEQWKQDRVAVRPSLEICEPLGNSDFMLYETQEHSGWDPWEQLLKKNQTCGIAWLQIH